MRLAKEHDVTAEGSLTRLATEDYVTTHSGGPAFDPLVDLATLIDVWIEADKTTEANGVRVNSINDAGPNNHDAVKTTTNGATKVTGVINGQPVLRFAEAEMYDCGAIDLSASGRKDMELILVGRMNTVANEVILEHGDNAAGGTKDFGVHAGQSGGSIEYRGWTNNGGPFAISPYPGAIPYTFFSDFVFNKEWTANQLRIRYSTPALDLAVTNPDGNSTDGSSLANSHLYIGGRSGNAVLWAGDIALVALMKRITDQTVHGRFLNWLKTKYGVPLEVV